MNENEQNRNSIEADELVIKISALKDTVDELDRITETKVSPSPIFDPSLINDKQCEAIDRVIERYGSMVRILSATSILTDDIYKLMLELPDVIYTE